MGIVTVCLSRLSGLCHGVFESFEWAVSCLFEGFEWAVTCLFEGFEWAV